MALDAEQIARRALDLLSEVGVEGLTTRRLADEFGIRGPTLYYHFRNKAGLFGRMATEILRESLAVTVDHRDWKRWLFDHAVATRATLLRYRDSVKILAMSSLTEEMKWEIMPAVRKPLIDAGFKQIDANETVSLIAAFTMGFVLNEQNEIIQDHMSSLIHVDRGFRHGVEALIAGVEIKYAPRAKRAPAARRSG